MPSRLAKSTSFSIARCISRASLGCAIAFSWTVVSTTTRSRSLVSIAPVRCATERLSCNSAAICSSPSRWRQRVSDERSNGSSCRKRWLPRPEPTDRTEASRQEVPIDLRRQTHQRMAKVDDFLQRWTKQIVLTIVARLAHGFSPTANLAVKGITKSPNPESENARKPRPTHGFLAKSNTCSRQITATNQSLPNSSRATHELCQRKGKFRRNPSGGT